MLELEEAVLIVGEIPATELVGVAGLIAGIIAAIIGARRTKGDRTATVVGYQGEILDDLNAELMRLRAELKAARHSEERLRAENRRQRGQIRKLEDRVAALEELIDGR